MTSVANWSDRVNRAGVGRVPRGHSGQAKACAPSGGLQNARLNPYGAELFARESAGKVPAR